jgi:hypothetical protein
MKPKVSAIAAALSLLFFSAAQAQTVPVDKEAARVSDAHSAEAAREATAQAPAPSTGTATAGLESAPAPAPERNPFSTPQPSEAQPATEQPTQQAAIQPSQEPAASAEPAAPQSAPQAATAPSEQPSLKERCDGLEGNAKDICKAEGRAAEKIAEAEATVQQHDTPKNRFELEKVRAEANYEVDKERCDDQVGDAKKACKSKAKAVRDLALAEAKMQSQKVAQAPSSSATAADRPVNGQTSTASTAEPAITPTSR